MNEEKKPKNLKVVSSNGRKWKVKQKAINKYWVWYCPECNNYSPFALCKLHNRARIFDPKKTLSKT